MVNVWTQVDWCLGSENGSNEELGWAVRETDKRFLALGENHEKWRSRGLN